MWDFLVTPFALWQQDQFIMMAILIAAYQMLSVKRSVMLSVMTTGPDITSLIILMDLAKN